MFLFFERYPTFWHHYWSSTTSRYFLKRPPSYRELSACTSQRKDPGLQPHHPLDLGQTNIIADALSHSPSKSLLQSVAFPVNACLLGPKDTVNDIIAASKTCPQYARKRRTFLNRTAANNLLPDHPSRGLKDVWHLFSLTEEGLLIIDPHRLYIPISSRPDILKTIHQGHCGIQKSWETAKQLYYWPTLKNDLKQLIDRYVPCQRMRPSLPKEPIITTMAEYPMQKTSADLFQVGSVHYLVMVDRYSGYPLVSKLQGLST